MLRRSGVVTTVVVVLAALAATAAPAGTPGKWSRVSATNTVNFAEPGLARTADGVLHVVWHHPTGPLSDEYVHTPIAPAGALGASTIVESNWAILEARPALVRSPAGGLALFFLGQHSTVTGDPLNEGGILGTFSDAGGQSWSAPQYVTSPGLHGAGVAAAVASGTYVTATADPDNLFHFGIGGDGIPFETRGCCVYDAGLGVDSASGTVVLAWFSNLTGNEGLFAQAISPSGLVGPRQALPGSASEDGSTANQPIQRTPVTGRIGAPGVYLAYGAGYPSRTSVRLLRFGGSPTVVTRTTDADDVNLAAAPDGRLWLMWDQGGVIYVTRTNRAATRFEPITTLRPPAGTVSLFGLWGEGSSGRLDLLASIGTISEVSIWHTQVLPVLDVKVTAVLVDKRVDKRKVEVKVTDAGDAVPGAHVSVGGSTGTTNGRGLAVLNVRKTGTLQVTATKSGYKKDSAKVRVPKKKKKRR